MVEETKFILNVSGFHFQKNRISLSVLHILFWHSEENYLMSIAALKNYL